MSEPKKTEKQLKLDKLIKHVDDAKENLKQASKIAKDSGDGGGAAELEKHADAVETTREKFNGYRDKKTA